MNAKPKRTVLNVVFKQTQRLPDWPLVKLVGNEALSEQSGEEKPQRPPQRPGTVNDVPDGQFFAE
jgi:hypothetical protein